MSTLSLQEDSDDDSGTWPTAEGPPPSSRAPVSPTPIPRSQFMPGAKTILKNIGLCVSLFTNCILRGPHKLKDGHPDTKKAWKDYMHEQFYGVGHDTIASAPLLMYKVWDVPNPHLKLKTVVLRAAEHFNQEYVDKERKCMHQFSAAEESGHQLVEERDAAIEAFKGEKAASEAAKERDRLAKENAESRMGLTSPGRGVTPRRGTTLTANEARGFAALGQQPTSRTINGGQSYANPNQDESSEDMDFGSNEEGDYEDDLSPDNNIPAGSHVRQRYELERRNAELAAAQSASAPTPARNATRTTTPSNTNGGNTTPSATMTAQNKFRNTPRHQDINKLCEGITSEFKAGAANTKELTALLRDSMNQSLNRNSTPTTPLPNSPNTKIAKKLNTANGYEDRIAKLRKRKKEMIEDNEPPEEIEEVSRLIKKFRAACTKLDDDLLQEGY